MPGAESDCRRRSPPARPGCPVDRRRRPACKLPISRPKLSTCSLPSPPKGGGAGGRLLAPEPCRGLTQAVVGAADSKRMPTRRCPVPPETRPLTSMAMLPPPSGARALGERWRRYPPRSQRLCRRARVRSPLRRHRRQDCGRNAGGALAAGKEACLPGLWLCCQRRLALPVKATIPRDARADRRKGRHRA